MVYGPEKIHDLKKGSDLVVGERTVVKQAAHYGVLRGALWCTVLGALLFWLPVLGPATAGYVGGRKAGGPVRAVLAVIVPAVILIIGLSYLDAEFGIVPSANTLPQDYDLGPLADVREQGAPIVSSLQAAMEAWVAAPPEMFFIMGIFAIVGGVLSSLRRAEEETIIERLGIPLGEVRERARAGEFGVEAQAAMEGPIWRRSSHPAMVAPVAAHDGIHDLVEMVVEEVSARMGGDQTAIPAAKLDPGARRRRRLRSPDGPGIEAMRAERASAVAEAPAHHGRRGRSTGGRAHEEALEVWEEMPGPARAAKPAGRGRSPRRRGTGPMHMGPGGSVVPKPHRSAQVRRGTARPRLGWLAGPKRPRVAYTARSDEGELQAAVDALSMDTVPEGASAGHRTKAPAAKRSQRSKRLPITSSILGIEDDEDGIPDGGPAAAEHEARKPRGEKGFDFVPRVVKKTSFSHGGGGGVKVVARSALDSEAEPPIPVEAMATAEASSPASKVDARPHRGASALRGRSKRKAREPAVEFEEELAAPGMVVWHAEDEEDSSDYFKPRGRRAREAEEPAAASAEATDSPDWEEERIAAMVRERDEWDRL